MTHQRRTEDVLDAFLASGSDEVADRVIEAALDEISHTGQRRGIRITTRTRPMNVFRAAAAATAVVVAVGGAWYLTARPAGPPVGGPGGATPAGAASASANGTPAPSVSPTGSPRASSSSAVAPRPPGWAQTGAMGQGRYEHSATVLDDGRVLVAGGKARYGDFDSLASAELYDPDSGSWNETGGMHLARSGHAAVLLGDGTVLVVGAANAERYDPATGSWSQASPLKWEGSVTRLADGRVLVAGLDGAEVYDPDTDVWTATAGMITPRYNHEATLLRDGRVLVVGGDRVPDVGLLSAELYDPASGSWSATGASRSGPRSRSGTLLSDGRVLDVGAPRGGPDAAEVYDPETGTWATIRIDISLGDPYLGEALPLPDGTVLFVGMRATVVYDPADGSWASSQPMILGRSSPTATVLMDGRVLVAGGYVPGSEGGVAAFSSAEVYAPAQ